MVVVATGRFLPRCTYLRVSFSSSLLSSSAANSCIVGEVGNWHDFDGNVEMCRNGRRCDADEDGSE